MAPLHPASSLILTLALLVAVTARSGWVLYAACAILALVAGFLASSRFRLIARRSRWLLLSMLVIFSFFTPGTHIAGVPGMSVEGISLGLEQAARLLASISLLALLLTRLSAEQLIAALYAVLAPLRPLRIDRDRVAVRIALTLEMVESGSVGELPRPGSILLPRQPFAISDALCCLVSIALLTSVLWP